MLQFRDAIRQLVLAPGHAAVAVLTLALGMGVNTAFFSLLHGVALREPPYPAADQLVMLWRTGPGTTGNGDLLARAELHDYRARQRVFDGLAASDLGRMTLTSTGDGPGEDFAERVKISRVTDNLFDVLGVAPAAGRGIVAIDRPDAPVAVISHAFWQTRLGGRPDAIGGTIRLNGVRYVIVGIMPAGFSYPEPDMAAWLPIDLSSHGESDRTDRYLWVIGRVAAGRSLANARADVARVGDELRRDGPALHRTADGHRIVVRSLRDSQFGHMRLPLLLLMAAAGSVLLIAAVNVAIMSLLRALARRRELAIRVALGASRTRIVRQLFAEAAMLAALGTAGGLLVASWGIGLLKRFGPAGLPRLEAVGLDLTATLVAAGALALVTVIVGLAPAMVAARVRPFESMGTGTRSSETPGSGRLRDGLTVAEIALAASLLVCAGLTVRSLDTLLRVELGFDTDQRFAFKTNLTPRAYPDAASVERFYQELTTRLAALPGTRAVASISYLPLSGEGQAVEATPLIDAPTAAERSTVGLGIVRGPYFDVMGVRLLHGRTFGDGDRPGGPPVALIDARLARAWWPTAPWSAVGRTVRVGTDPEPRTIVGVVQEVRHLGPAQASLPMLYVPQAQVYQRGMYTVVRTSAAPEQVMAAARAALAQADPDVPLYFGGTVQARHDEALAVPRFVAGLTTAFSSLALGLAGLGIFGVTAYAVAQRRREFGIRLALGAQRRHVRTLVLKRVGRLAAIGVVLGGAAGLALGRAASGLLFGVEAADPPTLAATGLAIAATALLASVLPLRAAVSVSLTDVLRAE